MKDKVIRIAEELKNELIEMSTKIYNNPELGYEEYKSSKIHENILRKYGFEVEENFMGMKTAFKAIYKSSKEGPNIAFLSEYDALPGIGHGCGHNILGTTSTGAAIVLSKILDDVGGTIFVFGTPAEETSGAKVKMADGGVFDEIDVALIAHPSYEYNKSGTSLAIEPIQFDFYGKTSHAAASPEKGINALDAVINTFNNINALRQQIKPEARIHGIIINGGEAPNVIPEHTTARFYVRAPTKIYLKELAKKVKNCAKGASLAAGTKIEIFNYEDSYDDLITNEKLSAIFTEKLNDIGINNINNSTDTFGSLDTGNVSQKCPTIHPYFDITNDRNISTHTIDFAESTLTEYAYDNMIKTIEAFALTGYELAENPEKLKEVKEEFKNIKKL